MKKKKQRPIKAGKQGSKPMKKVELAMQHSFYLEASMIYSAMFEKRLKRLLGEIENQNPGAGFTLEQSIKRLKFLHVRSRHAGLQKYYSIALIDELRNWKNQRNEILKDIPDVHVSEARIERLALDGRRLLDELKKAGRAFKAQTS